MFGGQNKRVQCRFGCLGFGVSKARISVLLIAVIIALNVLSGLGHGALPHHGPDPAGGFQSAQISDGTLDHVGNEHMDQLPDFHIGHCPQVECQTYFFHEGASENGELIVTTMKIWSFGHLQSVHTAPLLRPPRLAA